MPRLASCLHVLRYGTAAACAALALNASADTVTYAFTASGGHQGSFSYDDTRTSTQISSPSSPDSSLSFTLDGQSFDTLALVLDNDNMRYLADMVYLTATNDGVALQLYAWGDLFKSSKLSELNGRTAVNFTDPTFNRTRLRVGADAFYLTSLQQVPSIPEPGTGALMLTALVGCGAWRLAQRRLQPNGRA